MKYLSFFAKAGASASFFNQKIGCAPIHVAADEGEPEKILLLLQVNMLLLIYHVKQQYSEQ